MHHHRQREKVQAVVSIFQLLVLWANVHMGIIAKAVYGKNR